MEMTRLLNMHVLFELVSHLSIVHSCCFCKSIYFQCYVYSFG